MKQQTGLKRNLDLTARLMRRLQYYNLDKTTATALAIDLADICTASRRINEQTNGLFYADAERVKDAAADLYAELFHIQQHIVSCLPTLLRLSEDEEDEEDAHDHSPTVD